MKSGLVLVVDDEPIGLEVVKALLSDSEYDLHYASSGPEAIARALTLQPDLILLDVLMPGMDGYDVCRAIRDNSLIADVPIILLTALNDRKARLKGLEAGADDFISKPFDRIELSARVGTILRLNRYRRLVSERAKFDWVVEAADEGYLHLNADYEITYANPQARHLLQLPSGKCTGHWLDFASNQYQLHPRELWPDWASGKIQSLQLVRPQSDMASALWLDVDVMMDELDSSCLIRLRDITSSVIQQQLMWSFHAQIQHKFRHPLSTLSGHLELLRLNDAIGDDDRVTIIDRAYNASNRLKTEILSVLDYLAVTNEDNFTPQACSAENITTFAQNLPEHLDGVNVVISAEINPHVMLPLSCRTLELILWELFENSQKFHPNQAPTVQISAAQCENTFKLCICDNGTHLTPDQLQKMWMPYYQSEPYFTGQVPGLGLGLAMVASSIWSVGGSCTAVNRTDTAGLEIMLTIPIKQ